ncbi:MAG: CxxxxCH/CxxCH domain-containing protein, partial [Proteobacteria bacterium]|nr:CxxxxCH/CxxCH domain-containing protein [Pseudomonadota bacterium]
MRFRLLVLGVVLAIISGCDDSLTGENSISDIDRSGNASDQEDPATAEKPWVEGEPENCTSKCHAVGGSMDPLAREASRFASETAGGGSEPAGSESGSDNYAPHAKHVAEKGFACNRCHYNYVVAPGHGDGELNENQSSFVIFDPNNPDGQWDDETKSCSSLYCHGTVNTPQWYASGPLACSSCHSSGSGIDPLETGSVGVLGKHRTHTAEKEIDCTVCHDGYRSASSHVDFQFGSSGSPAEEEEFVFFGGQYPADGGGSVSAAFASDDGGCSEISCHGGYGEVEWYSEATGCAACHGGAVDLSNPINPFATSGSGSGGKHAAHVSDGKIDCQTCHRDYKSRTTHMNGVFGREESATIIEFDGAFPVGGNVNAGFDDDSGGCSDVSCHGGTGAAGDWYADSVACLDCHRAGTIDPSSTGGSGQSGKHQAHLNRDIDCVVCHENYPNESGHMNGIYGDDESATIVRWSGEWPVSGHDVTADFDDGDGACNAVSCHGGGGDVGWYQTAETGCTDCHASGSSIDPLSTGGGGASGKHGSHAGDRGIDCEICHLDYRENPNHINGTYGKLESSTIVGMGGDWPGTGNTVVATFNDGSGGCANVSCHGNTGGMTWYQETSACTDCHSPGSSIDPKTSGGSGTTGKHTVHATDRNIDCEVCHYNYMSRSSHLNSKFGDSGPTTETEPYIAFGGDFQGTAVEATFDGTDTDGGCADISCHGGSGTGGDWYRTSAACTDCHSPGSGINPLTSNGSGTDGKHVAHVHDKAIDCLVCHDDYKTNENHINGVYGKLEESSIVAIGGNWPGSEDDVSADFSDADGGCDNISCHGGTGGIGWYDEVVGCTACHGDENASGNPINPIFTNGAGQDGKHYAHTVGARIECESCHKDYSDQPTHMNRMYGTAETVSLLGFGGSYSVGGDVSADFDGQSGSCSDISCHGGSGSGGVWYFDASGDSADIDCIDCHRAAEIDPLATNGSASFGKHDSHVSSRDIGCTVCHADYRSRSTHMNGLYGRLEEDTIVVPGGEWPAVGADVSLNFGDDSGGCSDVSCHGGSGNVNWYQTAQAACTDCHQAGTSIDPLITGGIGNRGKHAAHFARRGIDCETCHLDYPGSPAHINGIYGRAEAGGIVIWGGEWPAAGRDVTADFDADSGGCDSVSCHGGSGSVSWYQSAETACTDCHAPGTAIDPLATSDEGIAGKHRAHADERGIECETCHRDYFGNENHINGTYGKLESSTIVGMGGEWPGAGNTVTTDFTDLDGSCANISCHGTTGGVTWYQETSACTDCHSPGSSIDPVAGGGVGTAGKHTVHAIDRNIDCQSCHNDYMGSSSHLNTKYGDSGPTVETSDYIAFSGSFLGTAVDATFDGDDADGGCADVSCHGGSDTGGDWYAASNDCTACHAPGSSIDPRTSGGSGTSGKHDAHVGDREIDCRICHDDYKNNENHINGVYGKLETAGIVAMG